MKSYSQISQEQQAGHDSQSIQSKFTQNILKNTNLNQHLDLTKFKTMPCQNQFCYIISSCPYFHSNSDIRRNPEEIQYQPKMCQFGKNCLNKQNCLSSHNKYEIKYHPKNYRKKYCKHVLNPQQCQKSIYCSKAHSPKELKVDILNFYDFDDDFFLFKYKTEFCPIEWQHNYEKCVYAHSWEDFRRDIIKYPYGPAKCEQIQQDVKICQNFKSCPYSHGWYEQNFHPLQYKRTKCDMENCLRTFCPMLHEGDSERFIMISKLQNFYIHPYNRINPDKKSSKKSFFEKPSENIFYQII